MTGKFGAKHLAFLIYLFHERRPMHPSEIIELLGRGRDEETELKGIKRTVSFLSEKLPGLRIMMTAETIEALRGVVLDTVIVEDALDRDDPAPIAKVYRGDFLAGFESDSAEFDAWVVKERARINRAWSRAILGAAREADRNENWKAALGWWRVRVARVPLHDEAVAGLLRALARAEGKNAATEAYARYLSQLKKKGQPEPADAVKKVVIALGLPKNPGPPKPVPEVTQPPVALADRAQTLDTADKSDAATAVAEPPVQVEQAEPEEPVEAAPEEPAAALASPPPPEGDNGQQAEASAEWKEFVEVASADEAEFLLHAMAEATGEADGTVEKDEPEQAAEAVEAGDDAAAEATGLAVASATQAAADTEERDADVELMATDELPFEAEGGTGAGEELEIITSADMTEDILGGEPVAQEEDILGGEPVAQEEDILGGEPVAQESDLVMTGEGAAGPGTGGVELSGFEATPSGLIMEDTDVGDASVSDLDLQRDDDTGMTDVDMSWRADLPEERESGARDLDPSPAQGFAVEPVAAWRKTRTSRKGKSKTPDSPLFTDSAFVHLARTAQARLATPGLVKVYEKIIHATATVLAAAWVASVKGLTALGHWLRAAAGYAPGMFRTVIGAAGRAAGRAVRAGGAATKAGLAKTGASLTKKRARGSDAPADTSTAAPVATEPSPFMETETAPPPAPPPVPPAEPAPVIGIEHTAPIPVEPLAAAPFQYTEATPVEHVAAPPFDQAVEAPSKPLIELRRIRQAAMALLAIGAVVVVGPKAVSLLGGLGGKVSSSLPRLWKPSLPDMPDMPDISLPKVSLPKVSVPDFGEMLAGPVLDEPGAWVVVADLSDAGAERKEPSPSTLTAALEADLSQARYFFAVPRERALNALRKGGGGRAAGLSVERALSLAKTAGYTAVLAGRIGRDSVSYIVELRVLAPSGEELYSALERATDWAGILDAFQKATLSVRRKLGEPSKDIEAGLPLTELLSSSPKAISAYARARQHLYAGRYDRAVREAQAAIKGDPGFAMAYRVLADAQVLRGRRRSSRAALRKASELQKRLSERERLRVEGDLATLDGRLEHAFSAYDGLFERYRDEAGALRSLVIVQRMVGARGGGRGNLRMAYTIDPYDWPALSHIAQMLGYRGSLPSVDSLIATLQEAG